MAPRRDDVNKVANCPYCTLKMYCKQHRSAGRLGLSPGDVPQPKDSAGTITRMYDQIISKKLMRFKEKFSAELDKHSQTNLYGEDALFQSQFSQQEKAEVAEQKKPRKVKKAKSSKSSKKKKKKDKKSSKKKRRRARHSSSSRSSSDSSISESSSGCSADTDRSQSGDEISSEELSRKSREKRRRDFSKKSSRNYCVKVESDDSEDHKRGERKRRRNWSDTESVD